ncbi:hypothetical protein C8A00DRAFT_15676, partial [Chaetomidium leptoderma]
TAMAAPKPIYSLLKPLDDDTTTTTNNNENKTGLYLVRRTTDGELLLARPLDNTDNDPATTNQQEKIAELMRRGAGTALANLLNHENLISIHDEFVTVPLLPGSSSSSTSSSSSSSENTTTSRTKGVRKGERRMFLWDWCDAGTLQGVFDEYELAPAQRQADVVAEGFLPESIVWHVGLGLLRALQWLHEGVRETYGVVAGVDGKRCKRVRGTTRGEAEAEVDWMPVLHRDLTAGNVFLQHPRGIETYGAVKLGNFERCWVSGSVARTAETPVVAMEWEDDVSLGELRERKGRWERDGLGVVRSQRPYTQGSELFAVGALLYRMMVGRPLAPPEECGDCGCVHITCDEDDEHIPCDHDCVGDVNIDEVFKPLFNYTADLKHLVILLLRLNRNDEWWASTVLDFAWPGFENWAANTEDGRLYRDIFDDIWFRKQNQARYTKRRREAEEEDVMEVDDSVLVFGRPHSPTATMSRIMQMPPPPPLLLTKRVTSFLRANLSPHIHSAMLTTPAGSLLAHASNLPASALRRQAAVAASLWALQGPSHANTASPAPTPASIAAGSTVRTRKSGKHSPPTVTVQLDSGAVFVIRRLRCGMLFICMGGSEAAAAAGRHTPTPPAPHLTRLSRSPAPIAPTPEPPTTDATTAAVDPSSSNGHARPSTPPSSQFPPPPPPTQPTTPTAPPHHTTSSASVNTGTTTTSTSTSTTTTTSTTTATSVPPGSPSEAASILSSHTTASGATVSGNSVSLMRRQVEELARWLDERLGGLCVPEEGIGIHFGNGDVGGKGVRLEVR